MVAARSTGTSSASRALDAAVARRAIDRPAVTALLGPAGLGIATARAWAASRGRDVIVCAEPDVAAVASALASAAPASRLLPRAASAIAHRVGATQAEVLARWARASRDEIERLHGRALDELDVLAHIAIRAVLDVASNDRPGALAARLRARADDAGLADDDDAPLAALARLLGREEAPAVVLLAPDRDDPRRFVARAAVVVDRLASIAPDLLLLLAGARSLDGVAESRGLALLREGAAPVESLSREAIAARLGASPRAAEIGPAARRLADDGADDALVDAFARAAGETGDLARSAAERFLFARLESLPWSAGRFALNAHAEVAFGGRPAEVDLLSRDLRIAVEIDGIHHFGDLDRYRRDRRKDVALQSCGYLVLRFLAEDVVARLEEILDTLHAAVDLRTRR